MKTFIPRSALVFASVLATLAILIYLRAKAPSESGHTAANIAGAAESALMADAVSAPAAVPRETKPTLRGEADAAHPATVLFHPPARSVGPRLDPHSVQIIKASTAGQSHEGRTAVVDARSLVDLTSLRERDAVRIPLMDGDAVAGVVKIVKADAGGWVRVGGELTGARPGSFAFAAHGNEVGGFIQLKRERLAYQFEPQSDGRMLMVEKRLSDLICEPLPRMQNEAPRAAAVGPQAAVPILNSRPAALCQLYMDFDGETVTDPAWNNGQTIVAAAFNISNADITTIFERVREDWWPFNINVTTDVAKYNSAPVKKRMRVIITPTDTAAPGAGGVAYLNSFAQAGSSFSNTIPCWVFNAGVIGISEAVSHETGHTMGLRHDGRTTPAEEYYLGHGTGATGWCPIMGAGYYKSCVQWSKGEYTAANNQEDDLAIISNGANSFGYIADDAGGTLATAAVLNITGGSNAVNQVGTIERTNDADLYSFATTGGTVVINAQPATPSPNLDIALAILDSTGTPVVASNPPAALNAAINFNLPPGQYFVSVGNSGAPTPPNTGYTTYASLGLYTLTGSVQGATQGIVITSAGAATVEVDSFFSYQITTSKPASSYGLTGTLPAGVTLDLVSGLISGTPTQVGIFNVTLSATDAIGTAMRPFALTVTPHMLTLGEAVNAPALNWVTSGSALWFPETDISHDGQAAAQSGSVRSGQDTVLETQVTGPTVIHFQWKVKVELGAGTLEFLVDDTLKDTISGDTDWSERTVTLAAGVHTLHWRYARSSGFDLGTTGGFVDQFSVDPRPFVSSPLHVSARVGRAFNYQITAVNSPTSYALGVLPAWLSFDPSTHVLSGTPTVAGTVPIDITPSNAAGSTTSTLTVHVNPTVPGDDLFDGAEVLHGSWVNLHANNLTATGEDGEPPHGGQPGSHSIWFSWQAPSTGPVIISTQGSSFDTTLAVYVGDTLPTVQLVAQNDNSGNSNTSRVRFFAVAATVYHIAVDSAHAATGEIALNIVYQKAATFASLIYGPVDGKPAGVVSMKITASEKYTGSLTLGGHRYRFLGKLVPNVAQLHTLKAHGAPTLPVSLLAEPTDGTDTIAVSIQAADGTYECNALRALSPNDLPGGAIGGFNIGLSTFDPAAADPRGVGYGRLTVSRNNRVRIAGQLGDGRHYSAAGVLDLAANYPLFSMPYTAGGLVGGALAFDLTTLRPAALGNVRWLKSPDAGSAIYPLGFDLDARASGARYLKPHRGTTALSFSSGLVDFAGSDLALAQTREPVTITSKNVVIPAGTIPGFTMKIDAPTGLFLGSLKDGAGKKHEFSGALLQEEDRGVGVFVGTAQSGGVEFRTAQ